MAANGAWTRSGSWSAAIRPAAIWRWRRRCCCATPAGPALKGILANYPVSDSRFDTPSYQEFGAGGYGLNLERMSFYWNVYAPHDIDRLHPLAAPLRADLTGLPPVMVLLAELDVLRSEGEALVEKLRRQGVPVETHTFMGTVHGFLRATATVQKARDAVAMAGTWMVKVAG